MLLFFRKYLRYDTGVTKDQSILSACKAFKTVWLGVDVTYTVYDLLRPRLVFTVHLIYYQLIDKWSSGEYLLVEPAGKIAFVARSILISASGITHVIITIQSRKCSVGIN